MKEQFIELEAELTAYIIRSLPCVTENLHYSRGYLGLWLDAGMIEQHSVTVPRP
jgi:hypothetical protein